MNPIASIHWIIEKAREFQKNIYLCFFDYTKAFEYMDHKKLWKLLEIWEYQTILPVSWETCMQVKKQKLIWKNWLVQEWERSMTGLSAVTLLVCLFLCPCNSPSKNTGVDCHCLLQGTFPTQGLNPLQADSLPSEPPGKPPLTYEYYLKPWAVMRLEREASPKAKPCILTLGGQGDMKINKGNQEELVNHQSNRKKHLYPHANSWIF